MEILQSIKCMQLFLKKKHLFFYYILFYSNIMEKQIRVILNNYFSFNFMYKKLLTQNLQFLIKEIFFNLLKEYFQVLNLYELYFKNAYIKRFLIIFS